jgi:hypothetical protein
MAAEHADRTMPIAVPADKAAQVQALVRKYAQPRADEVPPTSQPIARDVTGRGRSGRPIETEPLPIGTEDQILERGEQRLGEGPRVVPKDEQQRVLRQNWSQHGAPLDYDDPGVWEALVDSWNRKHPDRQLSLDEMDARSGRDPNDTTPIGQPGRALHEAWDTRGGKRVPVEGWDEHFKEFDQTLEGQIAPFPGAKRANEYFESDPELHKYTAYSSARQIPEDMRPGPMQAARREPAHYKPESLGSEAPPGAALKVPMQGRTVLPVQTAEQADNLVRAGKARLGELPALGTSKLERDLTSLDIHDPKTAAAPKGSREVEQIGAGLMKRSQAALKALGIRSGRIEGPGLVTDEYLARAIAHEVREAMKRSGHAGSWYNEKVQEAMRIAQELHPELADPGHRMVFRAALAITSQNEVVTSNVRLAMQAYEHYKRTGKLPTNIVADKQKIMNSSFQKLNELIEQLGHEGTEEFLNKDFTVRDLEKFTGKSISGENKDTVVKGSAIFGPKIGQGFYQNLGGNFNPVTMDLWFMRGWNRLTGRLVGNPTHLPEATARFSSALQAAGRSVPKTKESLYNLADQIRLQHERDYKNYRAEFNAGTRKKSELVNAAVRYQENLKGIRQQPTGGGEREWIRSVVNRARELLEAQGHKITNADLQALWWYPEKELYSKLGGRKDAETLNVDYASALRGHQARGQ